MGIFEAQRDGGWELKGTDEQPIHKIRLWAYVCRTGLFAPGALDPYTERLERIREAYLWVPTISVSSHNDPVPRNVLFDGERLWLIDWESAYRNDPLVDVAIALDRFGPGAHPRLLRGSLA